ncbi:MAG: pectate lyase [Prevotella sp.]|nr:pectate lyase [Prevotella sp.]
MKRQFFVLWFALGLLTASAAPVTITGQEGWLESACVTWQKVEGLTYNVYVRATDNETWTQLDSELVREYPDYGRADALGLPAGSYQFRVVPVSDGIEQSADATLSESVSVKAYDRSGFAHKRADGSGIGAYNDDGTLKSNARILYVWGGNAKTVSLNVVSDKKGKQTAYTGLQNIIYGYQKGDANGSYDTRPLCIRIVGTLRAEDMDNFLSKEEGLQIKGAKEYQKMNITLEGVGNDATIWGFGILLRNTASVELRNLAIMRCMDDAVSIDTKNEAIWVHNLDLFYGQPGSAADQAKGDGTIDMKGDSRFLTISYNHFFDNGKSSLCGMKSETGPNYITYHHNWFDHSDSRHPRIRTMSVHVWNNYFDGNSKYGVGVTTGASAYVDHNYFRNCKYPMLISRQGTDATGSGTFSGETGGVIKSYANSISGAKMFTTYQQNAASWDCWEASAATDVVPADVKALSGGSSYDNFDTNADVMYAYTPDAAADVPAIVMGSYGAGRMQHGDFSWDFDNETEDTNASIISELSKALQNYQSALVGFFGNVTSLRSVRNPGGNSKGIAYNLKGEQVKPEKAARQLYIQNGRKYIRR